MKKESIFLLLQGLLFYLFPLVGGVDPFGMVISISVMTLLLAGVSGFQCDHVRMKLLYPFMTAILFIPSAFIYYNETALVHALWYGVIAMAAIGCGTLARSFVKHTGK